MLGSLWFGGFGGSGVFLGGAGSRSLGFLGF